MKKVLIASLLIVGCAPVRPPINLHDEVQVKSAIAVSFDQYEKTTNFQGPNGNVFLGATYREKAFLRATKINGDVSVLQVYVSHTYGGDWRFYDRAYDINGRSFRLNKIDSDVLGCKQYIGCTYEEHLGINIDVNYLEENLDSGMRFKVVGRGGQQEFQLTPEYVRAFYLRLTDGQ